jgi:hypothetical protein
VPIDPVIAARYNRIKALYEHPSTATAEKANAAMRMQEMEDKYPGLKPVKPPPSPKPPPKAAKSSAQTSQKEDAISEFLREYLRRSAQEAAERAARSTTNRDWGQQVDRDPIDDVINARRFWDKFRNEGSSAKEKEKDPVEAIKDSIEPSVDISIRSSRGMTTVTFKIPTILLEKAYDRSGSSILKPFSDAVGRIVSEVFRETWQSALDKSE